MLLLKPGYSIYSVRFMNYSLIYLFSVMLLISLAVSNYEQILTNLGIQMNSDKGLLSSFDLPDTTENRVKIANSLIFMSAVLAPLVLLMLLASHLTDSDRR